MSRTVKTPGGDAVTPSVPPHMVESCVRPGMWNSREDKLPKFGGVLSGFLYQKALGNECVWNIVVKANPRRQWCWGGGACARMAQENFYIITTTCLRRMGTVFTFCTRTLEIASGNQLQPPDEVKLTLSERQMKWKCAFKHLVASDIPWLLPI